MTGRNFFDLASWRSGMLCVGLDPDMMNVPVSVQKRKGLNRDVWTKYLTNLVWATYPHAAAYKLNLWAFLQLTDGMEILECVVSYIKPFLIPIILDAKFGEIGASAEWQDYLAFEVLDVDAVTVNPSPGVDALRPFLARTDKCTFALVHTSNPSAPSMQEFGVYPTREECERWGVAPYTQLLAYERTALAVSEWDTQGNCGLVVGATYPEAVSSVRNLVPHMPILIPGVGRQGGDLEASVRAGVGDDGFVDFLVNVSRAISLASSGEDWLEAAERAARGYHERILEVVKGMVNSSYEA